MTLKVQGIRECKDALNAFLDEMQSRKAMRAMSRILGVVAPTAAHYTPVDTATLINSQFSDIRVNGTRLTGRVGYSASYAVFVHSPEVKQTFKKPSAKKEFLKLAFEENESKIKEIVKQEMGV